MSVQLGLLHRLLVDHVPLVDLTRQRITRESFTGDAVTVYDFIDQHISRFNRHPEITTVESVTEVSFPSFPDEPIGFWIDHVLRAGVNRTLLSGVRFISNALASDDTDGAQSALFDLYRSVRSFSSPDELRDLSDYLAPVIESHDRRQFSAGMSGVPFGFPTLDEVSDGAQAGDTIAVVGRPGKGKSYLLCAMALAAHRSGHIPMFVSYEMSLIQVSRRIMALASGISSTALRLGQVSTFGRIEFLRHMETEYQEDAPPVDRGVDLSRPFHLVKGSFRSTVEDLTSLVREVRPEIVYVDGAYLLKTKDRTTNRVERVAYTTEALKVLAQTLDIPVVASYQFNRQADRRGSGSIDNIGQSDAIGQLASIVLSIVDEDSYDAETHWTGQDFKEIQILKGREGERGRMRVQYDMERMRLSEVPVDD